MTVQHVHVAEGGQAIVGNVNAPAEKVGTRKNRRDQPRAQLTYALGVAMPRQVEAERFHCQAPAVGGYAVCRMLVPAEALPRATETP